MVTYIYFVKCPNCEDEHFDFFDDAKAFAMGCLSKKPIITQTEVCRNDFGECTDSADLGTVWSWEDMMKDAEPEDTVFSKDETFGISEGLDDFDDFDIGPQIDEFDNSLDFDFEDDSTETLWVAENLNGGEIVAACWADSEDLAHRLLSQAFRERTGGDLKDCYIREAEADEPDYITDNPNLFAEAFERKPIPEGMTIEQLVEEMEENEDTVECTLCNDLFDKSECRKELNLGWLCRRCADDLTARGEGPVFKEDNYWDFLDEDAELKEASLSDIAAAANSEFESSWNADDLLDFAGVEDRYDKQGSKPVAPKTPKSRWVLIKPNPPIEVPAELIDCVAASDSSWAHRILYARHGDWYNKGWKILPFEDACKRLSKEDCERARHMDEALSENTELEELHDLGNEYDGGYPADSHLKLCPECGKETFDTETGICVACGFN